MDRNEISNSVSKMILDEEISPIASAVDFYNYWAQKTNTRIADPDTASWTLSLIKGLIKTDRTFLESFLKS